MQTLAYVDKMNDIDDKVEVGAHGGVGNQNPFHGHFSGPEIVGGVTDDDDHSWRITEGLGGSGGFDIVVA